MTKNSYLKGLLAAALVVAGGAAFAQEGVTIYNGQQLYAVGAGPHFGGSFSPSGNDPAGRMLNDGAGSDVSASDNIWTVTRTATPGTGFSSWKMGSWAGVTAGVGEWTEESSGNQWYDQSVGTITFFYRDNNAAQTGDEFQPFRDAAWTDQDYTSYVAGSDGVYLTGSFTADFGGTNWTPTDTTQQLVDDGTNGDLVSGDGIYSRAYNFSTSGVKEAVIFIDPTGVDVPNWNLAGSQIKSNGPNTDGAGNISFNVLPSQTGADTLIEFRASDCFYRVTPPAVPPPPAGFFAFGPWGNDFTSGTQMTADAGGYAGTFVVPTAGYYTVYVQDSDGAGGLTRYPNGSSGGYPFLTTAPNQSVRVNLHLNPLSDTDFEPTHNFLYTDPDSRLDLGAAGASVHFIGFLSLYGNLYTAGGTDDWDGSNTAIATETSAGSEVFVLAAPTLAGITPGTKQFKGHWNSLDINPAIGTWSDAQFGGQAGDRRCGISNSTVDHQGTLPAFDNGETWDFVVDVATGRTGRRANGNSAVPSRPSAVTAPVGSAVEGWQMFE